MGKNEKVAKELRAKMQEVLTETARLMAQLQEEINHTNDRLDRMESDLSALRGDLR